MVIYVYNRFHGNLGIKAQMTEPISFDIETTKKLMGKNDFLTNQYFLIRFREWKTNHIYPSDEEILKILFNEHIVTNKLMIKQYMETKNEQNT